MGYQKPYLLLCGRPLAKPLCAYGSRIILCLLNQCVMHPLDLMHIWHSIGFLYRQPAVSARAIIICSVAQQCLIMV